MWTFKRIKTIIGLLVVGLLKLNPIESEYYFNQHKNIDNFLSDEYNYNDYDKAILTDYYNNEVLKCGSFNNYHEENYFYTDGRKEINIYNGIIGYVINDFDNDNSPELLIFKIKTDIMNENYDKEIILEVVKVINGYAYLADTCVLLREEFSAETIECDISFKRIDESIRRVYLNYFERRVSDDSIHNRLIALDFVDGINILCDENYSAMRDEYYYYDDNFDFANRVMDVGIEIRDDAEIVNRPFLNDDARVKPITTIKRVNESLRDGYIESYMDTYYDDFMKFGFLKIRYGYTNIIMR